MNNKKNRYIPHFLADTCWYAMTNRMSDKDFLRLVKLRNKQGFTAVQIVVGIPPEVGIENNNAKSVVGNAWDLKGKINYDYLAFARKRIKLMNQYNLKTIIYGAWGNQIDWIGTKNMCRWWNAIIESLDDLDVFYCLTGELDIWVNPIMSKALLPNKTSSNLIPDNTIAKKILNKVYFSILKHYNNNIFKVKRSKKWSEVLEYISQKTDKPIIVHTMP